MLTDFLFTMRHNSESILKTGGEVGVEKGIVKFFFLRHWSQMLLESITKQNQLIPLKVVAQFLSYIIQESKEAKFLIINGCSWYFHFHKLPQKTMKTSGLPQDLVFCAGPPWEKSKPISPPQRFSSFETWFCPVLPVFTHSFWLYLLLQSGCGETFSPFIMGSLWLGCTITVSSPPLLQPPRPALNTNILWRQLWPPPPSPMSWVPCLANREEREEEKNLRVKDLFPPSFKWLILWNNFTCPWCPAVTYTPSIDCCCGYCHID